MNLPWPIPLGQVGGRVEFTPLPSGAIVVRQWRIRMPVLVLDRVVQRGGTRESYRLDRLRDEGGEVVRVRLPSGDALELAERAILVGSVSDSTSGAPLSGARVSLVGTHYAATTDEAGQFRMEGLPAGRYTATFRHPRLDSLPLLGSPETEVELRLGQVSRTELAAPPLARLIGEVCVAVRPGERVQGTVPNERLGALRGVVRDGAGTPVPGAMVRLSWSRWNAEFERRPGRAPDAKADAREKRSRGFLSTVEEQPWIAEATTDARGQYQVCHLPAEVPITLQAGTNGVESQKVTLQIGPNQIAQQDMRLPK